MTRASKNIYIYSDSSFDPKSKTGIMGYFRFDSDTQHNSLNLDPNQIKTQKILDTTNIKTEIKSVLWSLKDLMDSPLPNEFDLNLTIHSDCNSIIELPSRREKLVKNDFKSQKTQKPLSNAELYKELFYYFDLLDPELVWIKGHKKRSEMNYKDRYFSKIDKKTRETLRECLKKF